MLARSVQIIVLLSLSCFALAQHQSQQHRAAVAPQTTDCAATFTSGSGHNLTTYCVTINGNIPQFSRGGDEYIRVGGFAEGYSICDETANNTSYYDFAEFDSGNWLPSTFTSNATKAITTRITSDGIWQIINTVTKLPANAGSPGAARISMQIKNLTAASHDIVVLRYADVDFSRDAVDDFNNDFDFTRDTAIGLEPGFKSGLSLVNNTFTFDHAAFTQGFSAPPDPCNPLAILPVQPFVGDGAVGQVYGFTIPAKTTRTITMTYRPI